MNKYRNKITFIDGIRFASAKEGRRYTELKILLRAGKIKDLKLQVPYVISINGQKICTYKADFVYLDLEANKQIIEDIKGYKRECAYKLFRLKAKLMQAYGNQITEI